MAVLSAATIWGVRSGVAGDLSLLGLWAAIGVGCLTSSVALLRSIVSREGPAQSAPIVVGV
jgi:hypothetical protein